MVKVFQVAAIAEPQHLRVKYLSCEAWTEVIVMCVIPPVFCRDSLHSIGELFVGVCTVKDASEIQTASKKKNSGWLDARGGGSGLDARTAFIQFGCSVNCQLPIRSIKAGNSCPF